MRALLLISLCSLCALAAHAQDDIKFKALTPVLDSSGTVTLRGRAEQISVAKRGSKLPLTLLGASKVETSAAQKLKAASATLDKTESKRLTASQTTLTSQATKAETLKKTPNFFLSLLKPTNANWGGELKITQQELYVTDQAFAHLSIGEYGAVVFRFLNGGSAPVLYPPTLFFTGRSIPTDGTLEQLHHDKPSERVIENSTASQRVSQISQFLQPFTDLFFKTTPVQSSDKLRFVYVSLKGGDAYNNLGQKFSEKILSDTMKPLGTDGVEQDVVIECSSPDTTVKTAYREYVVQLVKRGPHKAFATIARVQYAADRTIMRKDMYEGLVTTDWQQTVDQISGVTHQPWEKLSHDFDL